MALDALKLAQKLHDALSVKADENGAPTPISSQTLNKAKGVIAALKAGSFSHAPGTVTGATSAGSPLSGGAAVGGVLTLDSGPMKAITSQGMHPTAAKNIGKENDALINYIATGTVVFEAGAITGTCASTGESPGPLVSGAGTGGKLVGLSGSGAAAAVKSATGFSGPDSIKHYTALIDYLLENVEAIYPPGSVTGVCPPSSGPLSGGSGTGGIFS